jgi:hypothetical protein
MIEPTRGIEGYWAFLRERYRILLRRRAGEPGPWTDDPVLRAWRFCNVQREDDRVTIWFREQIRDPLRDDPEVLFATVAFRWFNTITAGEILRPYLVHPPGWDRKGVQEELEAAMAAGQRIFTGAFMINSAPGKPKHIDVLDNLDWCRERFYQVHPCATKEAAFQSLLAVPRLGNFAAYQVVVDLQYTYLLEDAPDLNTFTVAGPGCAKGISLCFYDVADWYSYGNKGHQVAMLKMMRDTHECGMEDPKLWPREWPRLPLSDVENGFCEYAKWRTGHNGLRLKRKFVPLPNVPR